MLPTRHNQFKNDLAHNTSSSWDPIYKMLLNKPRFGVVAQAILQNTTLCAHHQQWLGSAEGVEFRAGADVSKGCQIWNNYGQKVC